MVILEISTGTWCQYCPGAAIGAEMLHSGGANVAIIEYHNSDAYANSASNARNSYYNIPGYPNDQFDGPNTSGAGGKQCNNGNTYSSYLTMYNQRYAVLSPMTIDISGTNVGNTYNIVLSINKKSAFSGTNPRVFLVLTESNIATPAWPPTGQCMTEVDFVERTMVPNESGTSISFASGNFQIVNLSFTKDASWITGNCELVAFVQDYNTKEIFNGTKVALNALPAPVVVSFSGTPTTGCAPLLVNYTNTTSGVNSFQWSFPGGTPATSSISDPSVTYNTTGTYDVTLTAWNSTTNRGNKKTISSYINVLSITPVTPTKPSGPDDLVINPPDQNYSTGIVPGAASYTWDLQPGSAGVITPDNNSCSINWDDTYVGSATLKVRAGNSCGDSPWSTGLPITISPAQFNYTIANDVQTSDRKLEFDLYLRNTLPPDTFELAIIQAGILVNSGILNGGTITASIVPGTSELVSSQQPTSITYATGTPNGCIKIAAKPGPQCGNGTIIDTTGLGTRICRVRITNSVAFASSSQANLAFNFTISPYPTKVFRYTGNPCSGVELTTSSSNCFSLASNPVLNGPPSLSVSPSDRPVSSSSGTTTFAVTCNAAWTVNSNQTWCTVSPSSGFGNRTITASYTENTSSLPRTANITVSVSGLTPVVVTVSQAEAQIKTVNLSLFLEGLYSGSGMMHPVMDGAGYHWGATIADKLDIQLNDGANYSIIVYTASDVPLNTDGTASFTLPSAFNGNYYLTIRHRNHIRTVSSFPVSFTPTTVIYDFDAPGKAYGNNLLLTIDGEYVIYTGDVNSDGLVDGSDLNQIGNQNDAFAVGYLVEDVNGDGLVDGSDLNVTGNNNDAFISEVLP